MVTGTVITGFIMLAGIGLAALTLAGKIEKDE